MLHLVRRSLSSRAVRLVIFGTAAFGLAAVACGGTTTVPATKAQQVPVVTGPKAVVMIKDSLYAPTPLEIPVGTTVVWMNQDRYQHTSTQAIDGEIRFNADRSFDLTGVSFNVIEDENGGTGSYTFTKPGTYEYFCLWHNAMRGTVVVK